MATFKMVGSGVAFIGGARVEKGQSVTLTEAAYAALDQGQKDMLERTSEAGGAATPTTASGTVAATTADAAIAELASEKVQKATITALTNSTGQTADNTIENVPDAEAAVTDTTAASLTSVNASLLAIEKNLADLAGKVNAILTALAP